ncbi:DUF4843 domain-containing protein [Pedobacter sp. MC2016-14]|uniref:DUF4843 domain-containing protein n=1 Tax=Pedobacter sp. MC2016-14 TaxID=2897327 RepID=UPI001E3DF934|nr:DUF4843 domain-containing protein [Pedobacter sp. MC2016-14]MCD0490409.1 DUF4843 domain-containing protein [Pedobacter sp. MC2016-14]
MRYTYISLLVFLTIAGCKKNDLQYFEEEVPLLNIWLGTDAGVQDSITHNFAYSPTNRDSIVFNYRIAGYPVNYDRTFELVTVDNDAKLLNFTLKTYKVPAGKSVGRVALYVDKPTDQTLFLNKDLKVSFTVKQSATFQASLRELGKLKITFKNAITKPDNWDNAVPITTALKTFFGAYSDEKYKFVIQVTGLSNFVVVNDLTVNPDLPPNTITAVHARALQAQCKIALAQYKIDYGTDKLDENRQPIVFP